MENYVSTNIKTTEKLRGSFKENEKSRLMLVMLYDYSRERLKEWTRIDFDETNCFLAMNKNLVHVITRWTVNQAYFWKL